MAAAFRAGDRFRVRCTSTAGQPLDVVVTATEVQQTTLGDGQGHTLRVRARRPGQSSPFYSDVMAFFVDPGSGVGPEARPMPVRTAS